MNLYGNRTAPMPAPSGTDLPVPRRAFCAAGTRRGCPPVHLDPRGPSPGTLGLGRAERTLAEDSLSDVIPGEALCPRGLKVSVWLTPTGALTRPSTTACARCRAGGGRIIAGPRTSVS